MFRHIIKIFLRLALATAFLSAVADRSGLWNKDVSVWGTWDLFLEYTGTINPWFPATMIFPLGLVVTVAEVLFALCLLIGYRTELFALLSGYLLLAFALAMTFSVGMKATFDYSVYTASAAAFALHLMKEKYLELDVLLIRPGKVAGGVNTSA